MNTFKLHSTQKVKLYLVDWVEFYLLGGILPRDHLVTWLSGEIQLNTKYKLLYIIYISDCSRCAQLRVKITS